MVGLLPGTGGARVQYEEIYQEADLECIEAVLEDHPEVRVPWGRPEVVEVGGVSPVLHVTVEAVVEGQIWRGRSPSCGLTGRSSWRPWGGWRRAEEEFPSVFPDHPGVPFARYRYALFLYQQGRAPEAEEVLVSPLGPGGGADAETMEAARDLLADIRRGSGRGRRTSAPRRA